jgi:hypothetical protein
MECRSCSLALNRAAERNGGANRGAFRSQFRLKPLAVGAAGADGFGLSL